MIFKTLLTRYTKFKIKYIKISQVKHFFVKLIIFNYLSTYMQPVTVTEQ